MAQAEEIVVDASVVVKWFTVEEYSDKALDIKSKYENGAVNIIVPRLLLYEVVNALRYNPAFGVEELKRSVKDLEDMQLTFFDFEGELAHSAIECAFRFGLSVYDSVYVALAMNNKKRYYTADLEVVQKTSHPYVRHIRDW